MEALKERIVRYMDSYKKEKERYNDLLKQLEDQKQMVSELASKFLGIRRDLNKLFKQSAGLFGLETREEKRVKRAIAKAGNALRELLPFFAQLSHNHPKDVLWLIEKHESIGILPLFTSDFWQESMSKVKSLRDAYLDQKNNEIANIQEEMKNKLNEIAKRYNDALRQFMEHVYNSFIEFKDSDKEKHIERETHHYVFEFGKQLGNWTAVRGRNVLLPEDLKAFEEELDELLRANLLIRKHRDLVRILGARDESEGAEILRPLLRAYRLKTEELIHRLHEPLDRKVLEKLQDNTVAARVSKLLEVLEYLPNRASFYDSVVGLDEEAINLILRAGKKFGLGPLSPETAENLFKLVRDELGYSALSALHKPYFRGLLSTAIESWEDLVRALEEARKKLQGAVVLKQYAPREKIPPALSEEKAKERLQPLLESMADHIYYKLRSKARVLRTDGGWSLEVEIASSSRKMLMRAYQLIHTLRALGYEARMERINDKHVLVVTGRKEDILRLAASLNREEGEKHAGQLAKRKTIFVNSLRESTSQILPMLRSLGHAVASGDVRIYVDQKKRRIILHVLKETHESKVALDKDFHALLKRVASDAGISTRSSISKKGKKVYIPLDLWVILARVPELREKLGELLERYAEKNAEKKRTKEKK